MAVIAPAREPAARRDKEVFFEQQVRPLLAEKCWDCHGEETQESGLRLDGRPQMLRGGHSGRTVVVPGRPQASELVSRVEARGKRQMPPDDRLSERQVATLKKWVTEGAWWPKSPGDAGNNESWPAAFAEARRSHWALQPVRLPPHPIVNNRQWVRTELDGYVLAALEDAGLAPSPPADRRTLIRRLTFDLWGLPPTAEQIDAFLADRRPNAYELLVERLLSSPRYGERWARYWLDVARYADTRGYAFGQERRYPYAYTYRDYVIKAFNDDLPYDRFLLEQIAADLLPDPRDDTALAALGFLTVGRKYNNRHEDIDDQIDVVGRGLLGLTVGCARCHDHKYDPIPSEDYYSLYGVFAGCEEPKDKPLIGDPSSTPGYAAFKQELDKRQAQLDAFSTKKRGEISQAASRRIGDYIATAIQPKQDPLIEKQLAAFSLSPDELRPRLIVKWRQYLLQNARPDHAAWGPLFAIVRVPEKELEDRIDELRAAWQKIPDGVDKGQLNPILKRHLETPPIQGKWDVVRRYGDVLTAVFLKHRGEKSILDDVAVDDPAYQQLAEIVIGAGSPNDLSKESLRGYLNRKDNNEYRALQKKIEQWQVDSPGAPPRAMVLADGAAPFQPRVFIRGNAARPGKTVPRRFLGMLTGGERPEFTNGAGRLELANAIVSPGNPLTPRVFVHRVWMQHFVRPMVATPSDFGVRTPEPKLRPALDALAFRFMQSGWSIKALHRMIVLSNTYRQMSVDRPECRKVDPENDLLWRMNRRRLAWETLRDSLVQVGSGLDLTMGGKSVDILKRPYARRRTVYAFIDRQDLPTLFRVFDLANPDQSSGKRPSTTVPQQALFLMNSPFVWEQSRGLATSAGVQSASTPAAKVTAMFRRALGRTPNETELQACVAFIEQTPQAEQARAWAELAQALLSSNEFLFVD